MISTKRAAENQRIFSSAAKRLEELVTSDPSIGLNKNVKVVYGALYATQKYLSNLVLPAFGQIWVSITDAASNLLTWCL